MMQPFNAAVCASSLALGVAGLLSQATSAWAVDVLPVPAASAPVAQPRLYVVVKGSGKVIADAEVLFSAVSIVDKKLFTDSNGLVTWIPPAVPKLKVRVIAAGWETHRGEVALPAGPLPHVVQLQAMPPAGPARHRPVTESP